MTAIASIPDTWSSLQAVMSVYGRQFIKYNRLCCYGHLIHPLILWDVENHNIGHLIKGEEEEQSW